MVKQLMIAGAVIATSVVAAGTSAGASVMCGGRAASIVGTDGADDLRGTGNVDVIAGLGGDDLILGLGNEDILCGGLGDDELLASSDASTRLYGGAGRDRLQGSHNNDLLQGGPGNDLIIGWGGSQDIASFADARSGVQVDLTMNIALGAGRDALRMIDGVRGSPFDDDLRGSRGSEAFIPGAGDDRIDGAGGWDRLSYVDAPTGVAVDLGDQTASGEGEDVLAGIEDLEGSAFDDMLVGDHKRNIVVGGDGRDTILGAAGHDYLAQDASFCWEQAVRPLEPDPVDRCERPAVDGPRSGGVVDGGPGNDEMFGGAGADTVMGRAGFDQVFGGEGDDYLSGGQGRDTVQYFSGVLGEPTAVPWSIDVRLVSVHFYRWNVAPVKVDLAAGVATGQGEDRLEQIENVVGSTESDTLVGDAGRNWLQGSFGNDVIDGGPGNDRAGGWSNTDIDICINVERRWGCEL